MLPPPRKRTAIFVEPLVRHEFITHRRFSPPTHGVLATLKFRVPWSLSAERIWENQPSSRPVFLRLARDESRRQQQRRKLPGLGDPCLLRLSINAVLENRRKRAAST